MAKVNTYINFDGNCEEAFSFYKSVFKAEFLYIGRYSDIPPADRQPFQVENLERIMHVTLPIGKGTILMGCDNPKGTGFILGNNISLSVDADTKDEADRIFNELSIGGQVKMLMNETFWGAYFGVLTDRFGINWLINFELNRGNE